MSTMDLLEGLPGDAQWSMEQRLAALPGPLRDELLDGVDLAGLIWDWKFRARPAQYVDLHDLATRVLLLGAGRGAGKTLSGSQTIREADLDPEVTRLRIGEGGGPLRFHLVGRTVADVRDVMIGGDSGILSVYPPSQRELIKWTPSRRELILPNGAIGLTFSAEEPDQLRGPQSHLTWADELAAWKWKPGVDGLSAWDNCRIGTRLGPAPFILATTTPKRTPAIRALWAEANDPASRVALRRMSTMENQYLAAAYLDVLLGLYQGTSIGAQELDGVLMADVAGALFSEAVLEAGRVGRAPIDEMRSPRVLVGVDPSVSDKPQDECGIVVSMADAALPALKRHGYVIADRSVRGSPGVWGREVVRAAADYGAHAVIVEINQGGALVKRVLREEAAGMGLAIPKIIEVQARQNKAIRAEPLQSASERGRVRLVNRLPELEDQLTGWVPGESGYSPDRLDAFVYSLLPMLFSDIKGGSPMARATVTGTAREHYRLTPSALTQPRSIGQTSGWR
jgi:phage terminase large subunit-like protein